MICTNTAASHPQVRPLHWSSGFAPCDWAPPLVSWSVFKHVKNGHAPPLFTGGSLTCRLRHVFVVFQGAILPTGLLQKGCRGSRLTAASTLS